MRTGFAENYESDIYASAIILEGLVYNFLNTLKHKSKRDFENKITLYALSTIPASIILFFYLKMFEHHNSNDFADNRSISAITIMSYLSLIASTVLLLWRISRKYYKYKYLAVPFYTYVLFVIALTIDFSAHFGFAAGAIIFAVFRFYIPFVKRFMKAGAKFYL